MGSLNAMINASSAFLTTNRKLNKKPIYVCQVGTYPFDLAFSTNGSVNLFAQIGIAGLVGAFTDSSGNVIQPIAIGYGITINVPPGATQLQLGINDDVFADNSAATAFDVTVNGVAYSVPGNTMPWISVIGGQNANFLFGLQPHDGASPVVVSGLTAGQTVAIKYVSGAVGWANLFGGNTFGPLGDPTIITGTIGGLSGRGFVTQYMPNTTLPWITTIEDLKLTINDMDGGSTLADLVFNVVDYKQAITQILSQIVFEGTPARILAGFVGMPIDQYTTLFTGVVNTVDSDKGNLEYKFTCSSANLKRLTQKIYLQSDPDVNGNTFAVDSKHPRTIVGHPLDILTAALAQAGILAPTIWKFKWYRDFIYAGLEFVFKLTSAPTAKDFIENEICKPLGMYLWEDALGVVTINSFYPNLYGYGIYFPPTLPSPIIPDPTITIPFSLVPPEQLLNVNDTVDVPTPQESELITQVVIKFEDDGTGSQKFLAENIADYDLGIIKYGMTDAHTIESQGLKTGFAGYLNAWFVSFLIFQRYGDKQLVLDPVRCLWQHCVLEPGDLVAVSEPLIPDRRAGILGILNSTFEVMDRTYKFMEGIVELKLLAIDLRKFHQFLITPDGEATFVSDSSANQAKYLYQSNPPAGPGLPDLYSDGSPANTLS